MGSDLRERVAAAARDLIELDRDAANHYRRELRRSDPEVARQLDVMLWAQGSEYREWAVTQNGDTSRSPVETPLGRSADRPQAPEEASTVSAAVKVASETASFEHPNPRAPGGDCDRRLASGQVLGRYQLVRVVGRGGFGEVWQAHDPGLQKNVAVKVPLPREAGRSFSPTTFLHEARKAASLRHPAIVQVHDVGEGGGGWYIVSEFVDGDSLRARLAAGRLSFDRAARIVATVAGALHAAHLAGLVHRDVKPANILLDRAGNAYLTDFGLAVGEDELLAERSKISGPLAYMAPEQIRGDVHLLDGRADIYALGAVLYEALTGRSLFRAESFDDYFELILRREPRPPRSVDDTIPEELERICLKCLAKEIRDRYRTARDLGADLETWLARSVRHEQGGWWKPAVGVLGLTLLGAAVGGAVLNGPFGGARPQANLPGPANPGEVRVSKVPTIKELAWSKGRGENIWEVLQDPDRLRVYTDSASLLQFGDAKTNTWELSATVRQIAGVGRVGLFFGYLKNQGTATATYEVVRLLVVADQVYLQRRVETHQLGTPAAGSDGQTYASVLIKNRAPEYTIRLVVRDNRLAEVYLNGEAMPELVDVPLQAPVSGPFGAFNSESDGVFSKLLFDGRSIPLLAEANARPPEKP